jgi:peptidyl-prolyl cis-trans isomerase C
MKARLLKQLVTMVLFLLSGAIGCRKATVALDEDLLARVGTNEIRMAEFQAEFAERTGRSSGAAKEVLEEMITRRALYAVALEKGLDRDPSVRRAWESLLIGTLKERDLQPRIEGAEIPDQEVKEHYEQNLARYTKPAQARLAILRLRIDPHANQQKLKELQDRMGEARQRAIESGAEIRDFGALAVTYSDDPSTRHKGGDVGWLDEDPAKYRWDPAVLAAGFALSEIGAVSEIVQTGDGLYLVKLTDRRAAETAALKQIEAAARHRLLLQKRQEIEKAFIAQARQSASIEIRAGALELLNPQLAQREPASPTPRFSPK